MGEYKPEPGGAGYYWVRWRRPYARRWAYDVCWIAEAAWTVNREVRSFRGWEPIEAWPNATFLGPLTPPEPVDERNRKAIEALKTFTTIARKHIRG